MYWKIKSKIILFLGVVLVFLTCQKNISNDTFKQIGNSTTIDAQQVLLKNLSQAIADSGFVHAINYCNIHADSLVKSQITMPGVLSIERLTDKNRNPQNAIQSSNDQLVFDNMKKGHADTVLMSTNHATYYKPIKIGMPTCLKCHGKENDLTVDVKSVLAEHYPNDLAKGYVMGDLRGMWKVTLSKDLQQQ